MAGQGGAPQRRIRTQAEYTWNDPRTKGRIFEFAHNDMMDDADDSTDRYANPDVRFIDAPIPGSDAPQP
jgi:hypothetical protein